MRKKISRTFANLSLFNKTFLILLVLMLLTNCSFAIGAFHIKNVYKEKLYQTVTGQVELSSQRLSDKLKLTEELSLHLLSNETIQSDLLILQHSQEHAVRNELDRKLQYLLHQYAVSFGSNLIHSITLYSGSFMTRDQMTSYQTLPDTLSGELRSSALEADGKPVWTDTYASAHGLFLSREIKMPGLTPSDSNPLGEIIINLNLDSIIQKLFSYNDQYDESIFLLLDGSDILYHSPSTTEAEAENFLHLSEMNLTDLTLGTDHYFLIKSSIPDYNRDYICLIPYNRLYAEIQKATFLPVCLVLEASCLILFLGLLIFISLGRHFQRLKKKMLLATEDLSSVPPLEQEYMLRHDEIGIMHQQFAKMIEELNRLIQENYVSELQTKEAQLHAMQSQINPHFLYNTLESINWRARTAGAPEISEMVQSLAALLRVSFRKELTPLSLKQELDLLDNYMKIQHLRFEDRLIYTIDVPDSLMTISIPALCLQPLAENAIRYGLEDSIDDCEIRIEGYEKNGWIHLIVRNTGSEFEDDQLRQLQENTLTPQGHGIGLINIFNRIRLTFGPKSSLCLYNQDGWAVAEIIIPEEETLC